MKDEGDEEEDEEILKKPTTKRGGKKNKETKSTTVKIDMLLLISLWSDFSPLPSLSLNSFHSAKRAGFLFFKP
jgi:hypothetical protein